MAGRADIAVFGQLGAFPRALGVTAAMLVLLAILPGLPALPFLLLAAGAGTLAWQGARAKRVETVGADAAEAPTAAADEPMTSALAMDPVRLELGYGLLGLIGDDRGQRLPHQIKALRRQLAGELGFVMPSVRIQDNIQLPANTYVVRLKEIEAGRGEIRAGMLLVMDPQGRPIGLPGESTTEPTFGLPATWIMPALRDEALAIGLTVVDPATVITTHLTEVVRDNLADLLTYAETQKLLGDLPPEYQKLMGELVPARITTAGIQRVLQGLLAERVSIRDLPRILEAIAEALGVTHSTLLITEHVRARLARQISTACTAEGGFVPILAALARLGAGVRRRHRRPGRRAAAGHGAQRAAAVRPRIPGGAGSACDAGRTAGAADLAGHQAVRPLGRRACSPGDDRAVAERDPRQGPHPHPGPDLAAVRIAMTVPHGPPHHRQAFGPTTCLSNRSRE